MRLRQLARKLEITPEDIITLLAEQGMTIDDRSNIKLEEEHVKLVYEKFSDPFELVEESDTTELVDSEVQEEPESIEEDVKEAIDEETPEIIEEVGEEKSSETELTSNDPDKNEDLPETEVSSHVEEQTENAEEQTENVEEQEVKNPEIGTVQDVLEDEALAENIDVIKAPKVSLPGLKVVGKIDLPDPKVKEPASTEDNEEKEVKKQRKNKHNRRNRDRRPHKKLTLEEQRLKEIEEKKRLKQEKEAKKKEERREKYLEQVKEISAQKQRKIDQKKKKKQDIQTTETPKKHVNPPKTVFGKFWRWLNT